MQGASFIIYICLFTFLFWLFQCKDKPTWIWRSFQVWKKSNGKAERLRPNSSYRLYRLRHKAGKRLARGRLGMFASKPLWLAAICLSPDSSRQLPERDLNASTVTCASDFRRGDSGIISCVTIFKKEVDYLAYSLWIIDCYHFTKVIQAPLDVV